jgi:3,4-dihydroxy 2-butanone 4-phosphate synthase/GTP cyclohydrolase II
MDQIDSIEDLKTSLSEADRFRARHGRPFVTVSYAQSVDGSIAMGNRLPIQLSGQKAAVLTHQIRAASDAILIGIGTLLADDPQLTVRLSQGRNPRPIILDTHLRTPLNAKLVEHSDLSPWIINAEDTHSRRFEALSAAGATPLPCTMDGDGKINLNALMVMLADMQVNSIMVEGGARVITSFLNSQLIDQFIITVSPKFVGGLSVIDPNGLNFNKNLKLGHVSYQRLGNDLIIWSCPDWE